MRISLLILGLLLVVPAHGAIIADHTACSEFDAIPEQMFTNIRNSFHIYYGHTSHGSQLSTGMIMLESENSQLYDRPSYVEIADDLGELGDTSWVQPTRNYLESRPECNLVMWSWCGGMSTNTVEGVNTYLTTLSQLELDYPDVTFVYMTGHLDGTGPDGILYRNNNLVREYCLANDKFLYDFADIESYDPDGTYYPDETDACNWCETWCSTHSCPSCSECAHSRCFNCYQKAKAFWWLLGEIFVAVPAENQTLGTLKAMYR